MQSAALSPFPPAEGPASDQRPGFPWGGSGPRLRTDLSGSAQAGETPCSFFLDACECEAGSWGFPGGLQGSPIKPVVHTVPYGNIGTSVSGTQVTDAVLPNEKVSAQQTADSPHGQPALPDSPQASSPSHGPQGPGSPGSSQSPPLPGSAAALSTSLHYFSGILEGLTGHAHCWPCHDPDLEPEHPLSPESHLPSLFSKPLAPISSTLVFQLTPHWENSPSQR